MFLLHYILMFKKGFYLILNPVSLIFLALFIQTLTIGLKGISKDPGLGWHIKTGEWIINNFSIPYKDPFLSVERVWVSDQWMSDIILFLTYKAGGFLWLATGVIILFFSTVFLLHTYRMTHISGSALTSAVAALFCFRLMQVHLIIRPVVFSFLLFTLVVWEVSKWEKGKRGSYLLPVLFLFWANLHPSFVLGGIIVAIGVITSKFRELRLAILCGLATFINPYGLELHKSILFLGQSDFFMSLNQEWRPPTDEHWFFLLFLLGFGVMPGILLFRKKLGWFWIISSILFFLFSMKAVRFMPYFGIIVSVPLSCTLSWYVWRFRKARLILKALIFLEKFARQSDYRPVVVCVLSFLLVYTLFTKSLIGGAEIEPPREYYPYGVLSIIPMGEIVAATPDWGGFLTLHNKRPIIDDRNTLIGEEFYKEYLNSESDFDKLRAWAKSNNANWLLVTSKRKDLPVDHIFNDEVVSLYRIVY